MKSHPVKNPFIVFSISVSVLMLVLSVFVSAITFEGQSGSFIINIGADGTPLLGGEMAIISLFGILAAIVVINAILVYEVYNRERFISYVLSISTVMISIIIFAAVSMVAVLN